ncbi:MAG: hypothetical protein EXR45_02445 [Chloroflexi bacterium]|nr:hypothetical protein [Chloroflexota bacterium]
MEPLEFIVRAGPHPRIACPVWVQLPVPPAPAPTLRLFDDVGNEVPCQSETSGVSADERLLLAFIVRDLEAHASRSYRLEPGPPIAPVVEDTPPDAHVVEVAWPQDAAPVAEVVPVADVQAAVVIESAPAASSEVNAEASTDEAVEDAPEEVVEVPRVPREKLPGMVLTELPDGELAIDIEGDHFTSYRFSADGQRPYFHPVVGPTGLSVTRAFPMTEGIEGETSDHPHHRGMWTAHGDLNGHDNWLEGYGKATIRHAGFSRLISGPVYGSFDAGSEWIDRWGSIAMTDTRRVTVFNVGRDERLVEISIRFSASHGQVTMGDTKEAGIVAIRVATSMNGPTKANQDGAGRIETSDGAIGEDEAWGRRASWCDYSGPVAEQVVGVAIMDHPTNPRFPTHWHVRNYGLMTANPFGLHDFYGDTDAHRGDFIIPPYESRVFRYRILVHRGDAAAGSVRDRYHDFANPPTVELC